MKDLLRKYPQWSHDCIAVVGNISSKNVQEPKAKAALIWMLGEYAQDMQDAPYVLESLVENWDEEHSAEVTFFSLFPFFSHQNELLFCLFISLYNAYLHFCHNGAYFVQGIIISFCPFLFNCCNSNLECRNTSMWNSMFSLASHKVTAFLIHIIWGFCEIWGETLYIQSKCFCLRSVFVLLCIPLSLQLVIV